MLPSHCNNGCNKAPQGHAVLHRVSRYLANRAQAPSLRARTVVHRPIHKLRNVKKMKAVLGVAVDSWQGVLFVRFYVNLA
jgi:hypothetical protein